MLLLRKIYYAPHALDALNYFKSVMSRNSCTTAGMCLKTVVEKLSEFAPTCLAESWDNVGLLVEPAGASQCPARISRILLTNDLTEDVIEEAVDLSVNMIISYHPPIFAPFKRITCNTWKERIIARCLANNIAVYSPHTSWDVVQGGLSDWLANAFEFKMIEPLLPRKTKSRKTYLLNIDCGSPECFSHLASRCSPPLPLTEYEILETNILDVRTRLLVKCSIQAMNSLIRVFEDNPLVPFYYFTSSPRIDTTNTGAGIGRKGTLTTPISIREAVEKLKRHLRLDFVQLAMRRGATLDDHVESVAFVAGSGGSVLKNIDCDLKVTGEASHHEVLDWIHNGSSVVLTNHSNSERGFLSVFAEILSSKLDNPSVEIITSTRDADPLKVI